MIMEHVWDYNFDPQTNVVETRVSRLRDKSTVVSTDNLSKLCGEQVCPERILRLRHTVAFRLTVWYAVFFTGGMLVVVKGL